ncbi:Oidioi.mRNA.OKI2018_I69.chr1.g319.t1.cds [Oikopleura dioica]|uniref:Oidioi.mRNA.OKI2018_I69.chr1.g319.t1.cds n=1 Tax=Oikopleura dioica TaxID=34765 RepID=A0ABN7STR7_OIKDI|nr:Oidioi.mRNA.OKI2018_I69.chr1.g319.t1.cds [Oikopleura dioica]
MLRAGKVLLPVLRRKGDLAEFYKVLNVSKSSSLKEIATSYFDLAKQHHPDHGGEEEVFRAIHKAYRELKKVHKGGAIDFVEAELSNRVPPEDAKLIFGDEDEGSYWEKKKAKIRALLGEQKFAIKGKGDPWSGFLYRVQEAPHMTDGFSEFYCLYLHAAYNSQALNTTILEVIDYMVDKTYFIHLDEKKADKYEYDWNDDDDDFILISLDGIYKQIYIGRDMPIEYGRTSLSLQPIISEVVEDFQYYLE